MLLLSSCKQNYKHMWICFHSPWLHIYINNEYHHFYCLDPLFSSVSLNVSSFWNLLYSLQHALSSLILKKQNKTNEQKIQKINKHKHLKMIYFSPMQFLCFFKKKLLKIYLYIEIFFQCKFSSCICSSSTTFHLYSFNFQWNCFWQVNEFHIE